MSRHEYAGLLARFNAMVLMPSEITVRIVSREKSADGDVGVF